MTLVTNLLAFIAVTAVVLYIMLWAGIRIGTARESERRRAIDADNHARSFRAARHARHTDKDAVLDMLKRTPGFSIEVEEREHSDLVRVGTKNQGGLVIFEFTKAAGHLLTVQPARRFVEEVRS
jgi:hypothetical protein